MTNIDIPLNNFARGQVDHDMLGRHDLPTYQTGSDLVQNFTTNFKGNAIYRPGFEIEEAFQNCVFIEFKFNLSQQYILVLYANKMRFLSYDSGGNFGWVLSGGTPLEVSTPWSLVESAQVSYSQNSDVMIMVHPTYPPYKLTRTGAASFTLATFTRTADPFTGAGLYPSCVLFYKGRLFYAAPTSKPTTIWASNSALYDNFTMTPVTATTALQFTIADIAQPILWLFPGDNSLIVGASDGIVAVNGGSVGVAVTPGTIDASLTSAPPCNAAYPFKKDGLIFYCGIDGRNLYYFSYDVLTSQFIANDANFISYDISKGGILKLRYKKDKNDLIFGLTNNPDLSLTSCNFNLKENIIGWHGYVTEGQFLDIAVITDNNGTPQLFALTIRNGSYYIEHQSPLVEFVRRANFFTGTTDQGGTDDEKKSDDVAYNRYIAEQLKFCNFLDNSILFNDLQDNIITYDPIAGTITATSAVFASGDVGKDIVYQTMTGYESGRFTITSFTSSTIVHVDVTQEPTSNVYEFWYRTFETLSGLTDYEGTTVSVVADGGYLSDFSVDNTGVLDLEQQVTSIVIGYKYRGIIKSFSLGMQIQVINTQTTMKAVSQIGVRCVASAGLKVGTSQYKLEDVQELTQDDINYLPPIPIDGTKYVPYLDDHEQDKYMYIIQDLPLPAIVAETLIRCDMATAI